MQFQVPDIIDIPKIQSLLEALHTATGITSAIVDLDGTILVAAGWQDICLHFHRLNPHTEKLCRKSDGFITSYLDTSAPYLCYQCANGLIDASAPIVIDETHVATVFLGQVFFEPPDREYFRQQAVRYGFCEEDYLEALSKVPVVTVEKFSSMMCFFRQLAENFAHMGMTKLRLLEAKRKVLLEARKELKMILDNTPHIAMRIYDLEGKLYYWNARAEGIFNCSQEVGCEGSSINSIGDFESIKLFLEKELASNQPIHALELQERSFVNSAGEFKTLYSTVFPIFVEGKREFLCMDIDLTEQKRIEKEMARMGKLNLVGEIAASLGHEVRNPLTTVRGFLQLLTCKNEYTAHKDTFELMISELDRCNNIITEFLSLAQNKAIKLEFKHLNDIVTSLSPLLQANALINSKNLILELGSVPAIKVDEQEIRQLIFNLVRNGIEAMTSRGCITIKTYVKDERVVLAIQDEGPGISPEYMEKLGTPFWTTKQDGTGLGLAVCYSIAARHKAEIKVESNSAGTEFLVYFHKN